MRVFITKMDFPALAKILIMALLGSQTPPEKEDWKFLVLSYLKVTEPDDPLGKSLSFLQQAKEITKVNSRQKTLKIFIFKKV